MSFRVVDARREDAPFLGWVMQAASRSHLERGVLDMFIDGSDEDCLRFLAALALTEVRHWGNFDNYIIVESEGQPAGGLCGYFVEDQETPILARGAVEVAVQFGWSHDDLVAAWRRVSANSLVSMERVPGAWVVESVAVLPAFRRRGLVSQMLEVILDRGRERGATCAEISVLIDNDAAQFAYERAGFAVVDEVRNAEFEAAFGAPGMRLLRRTL